MYSKVREGKCLTGGFLYMYWYYSYFVILCTLHFIVSNLQKTAAKCNKYGKRRANDRLAELVEKIERMKTKGGGIKCQYEVC